MDKNELTKVLFPYAMEVAKTFKLSEEEQKIITGEVSKFRLSEITKANEFMNTCIRMFIQDVAKNFTIEDLAKFVKTITFYNSIVTKQFINCICCFTSHHLHRLCVLEKFNICFHNKCFLITMQRYTLLLK